MKTSLSEYPLLEQTFRTTFETDTYPFVGVKVEVLFVSAVTAPELLVRYGVVHMPEPVTVQAEEGTILGKTAVASTIHLFPTVKTEVVVSRSYRRVHDAPHS